MLLKQRNPNYFHDVMWTNRTQLGNKNVENDEENRLYTDITDGALHNLYSILY